MLFESFVLSLCAATYVLALPVTNELDEQVTTKTDDSLKYELYRLPLKQRLSEVKIKSRNRLVTLCAESKNFYRLISDYNKIKEEAVSKYHEIISSYESEIKELEKQNREAYITASNDLIAVLEELEKTLKLEQDEIISKMKESLRREDPSLSSP